MNTLSDELTWRGFVNQTTFDDITQLDGEPITFYLGVDPSSDSMTIGNLAAMMMVRHFIDHRHKAVLLVGGATGQVGDPDGKSEERELKSLEEVERNKAGIAAQYSQVLAGQDFNLVDNYDWFKDIGYLQFLREVGKHFSMTQMLDRDFVQSRIGEGGSGISYAEFSYTLIQGYDFLHLFRQHGVTLQVCGADQWGNSISGVELIRKLEGKEAHIWSVPLIVNKATGKKFGKTEDGAIWLDETKTSVYKFYQFWLNTDDEGVVDYLKIYTLLPREEIERLAASVRDNPGAREAQKALAFEVTKIVHGEARAQSVVRVTNALFGGQSIASLREADLDLLAKEIPEVKAASSIVDALTASGLAGSNGEAKRFIAAGAVSVNGQKLSDDAPIHGPALLKRGKNSFALVR